MIGSDQAQARDRSIAKWSFDLPFVTEIKYLGGRNLTVNSTASLVSSQLIRDAFSRILRYMWLSEGFLNFRPRSEILSISFCRALQLSVEVSSGPQKWPADPFASFGLPVNHSLRWHGISVCLRSTEYDGEGTVAMVNGRILNLKRFVPAPLRLFPSARPTTARR